jgi:replicative DNA helicase
MGIFDRGQPVDLITVAEQLKQRNTLEAVGGMPFLTDLSASVPTHCKCSPLCKDSA